MTQDTAHLQEIHTITVKDRNGNEYSCRLKEPGFEEMNMAFMALETKGGKVDYAGAGRVIMNTCWVDGDEIIKVNAKLLFAACLQASSLVEIYHAEVKKN